MLALSIKQDRVGFLSAFFSKGNYIIKDFGFLSLKSDELTKEDIEKRNLPKDTTGVVITEIKKDSPINFLSLNDVIVEVQKKKIKTIGDLKNIIKSAIKSSEQTILIVIYNNQNQKRYIGVKIK